ncbi:alanyl-tRNA synthetase [Corynebacterium glutamicum MB001]|uniref:Alanine--tRNA ligase n=1 Tax=Corynebacterium glutamicum (strain ATCC 13032 / DSM 20300 / JCM 1318 / BCRC 11384 / CCUG 27702 / LMG 3730 / NBRC 12168 / NCIMB 10025 / NRRL B-2784 / 534) TaxID=196627 RepID=SYA_CORGL|nr:alanine--tRNA ligase [Corynebacterium glutamicum]Q8NQ22.1 RecName: Full=Alanine--tRNA ligase; AltName: Full=Alanyl-tRNA synthetase; Short=AlaRS [Corynebacterium glutamicum ATCC 13032]AGT05589.1 alanyl-tRNA synthetase [Corynebacterium glutamicum MB001]ASW14239.1 alanyl-tRNA synthetase [Corynebacterium glutamicum]AUI01135.1 alanine--tRNA ligase [Corynebacterium glutamicum]AUI04784.1 alanine--tRNA ligase [Corynebacterium glutamicum]MBA4570221.1 alanine--tRNA ligase [Corynebacterium glutamicum
MQTHEIRERFTNHFVNAGHQAVPSASLILDDPNLLFVNAGMVPFKPYFLGQQTPPFENGTATSIQKCVRTLDIEEVGITTRHNTFFQMAGNFSFGQYFKEGAITHAWGLLTGSVADGGFGLDPERLWVTVYLDDDEAAEIWEKKIGVPSERIQRLGMADNYWSMGVPGPCGPCSEIYYDRGEKYGKEGGPVADDNRYMEIWNLVFMEKERGQGIGKDNFDILGDLPKKNIDTGMGVERVACILQDVENVYETDLLRPVIDVAETLTGTKYGSDNTSDIRFRVIADHSRTGMMLILDGVTPGNEGRGYILRRLLRRIIRSARLLGATGETMEQFMNTIMDTMTPSYPEIADNRERIMRVAVTEERAFLKTLVSGTHLFEEAATSIKAAGSTKVAGAQAFALHDTYGFPIDLTLEMAAEAGLEVDVEGFDSLMAEQRSRAKADSQAKKHGHTDLSIYREWVDNNPTVFTGFEELDSQSKVLGLLSDGAKISEATEGQEVEVILDQSPLYAESGGQLGDRGQILLGDTVLDVHDVQKIGKKLWVHKALVANGGLAVGDEVVASVDKQWRHAARQAHTATHLIHAALRQVLGPTALQAGSMNKPGYLRFDFNYTEQLTPAQVEQIQAITNEAVDTDWAVNTVETSLEEAKAMGAMALFGENYGSTVRVVEIGGPFSMELCGGTHVAHSSQIGPVALLGESSIGSGVRRIEAYSGLNSFNYLSKERALAEGLASSLKAPSEELPERVAQLVDKLKAAEKEIEALHRQQLMAQTADLLNNAQEIGGVTTLLLRVKDNTNAGDLRTIATTLKDKLGDREGVLVIASDNAGKVPFVVAATKAAVARGAHSGNLVKLVGSYIDGRGGGKADLAQGSGANIAGLESAFGAVRAEIEAL